MLNTRLLKPLDYLRIRIVEKKHYDYTYPILFGTSVTGLLCFGPADIKVFGDKGLIDLIIGILQILTGFYIASLAAVATFNKIDMDNRMAGAPAKLSVLMRGEEIIETLTRRRFLCLMFGYLAFVSMFLYFLGGLANLFSPHAAELISSSVQPYMKWIFIWFYMVVSCNLIVTTLLGLFYMCDRIHRE